MSQFKHTPGPWSWNSYGFRDGYYGLYSGDEPVLYPQRENDGDDGDAWFSSDESYYGETALREADAWLIAAAPDLLEALRSLMDEESRERIMPVGQAWDKARAAIAKATGEA